MHCVGSRLLSLAQVFALDHYLVTFLPEPVTPYQEPTSVLDILHMISSRWHTCAKTPCITSLLEIALAGWDHRQTADLICTKVLTSHRSGLRLTARHKRWGQNVDWFWKFNYDAVSQGGCARCWQIVYLNLLFIGFQWYWMCTVYATFSEKLHLC